MWLFDLDGTLALMNGRDPFDWDRVGEDLPNIPVVKIARTLIRDGQQLGFLSGRKEKSRRRSTIWLLHHLVIPEVEHLWMRADDDNRPDEVVKREIYLTKIKPFHDIEGVYDDRDKVVRMWREEELTCFQVAEGNF